MILIKVKPGTIWFTNIFVALLVQHHAKKFIINYLSVVKIVSLTNPC
jgi:hypothetical protein